MRVFLKQNNKADQAWEYVGNMNDLHAMYAQMYAQKQEKFKRFIEHVRVQRWHAVTAGNEAAASQLLEMITEMEEKI